MGEGVEDEEVEGEAWWWWWGGVSESVLVWEACFDLDACGGGNGIGKNMSIPI